MVPATPTQPSPMAQPRADMRSVGMPITAAACRSCAVACSPSPVSVRVTTANRPGILATIGETFHGQGINISEANCRAGDDGRAMNTFTFLCSDLAQLKSVMRSLQKIPGVVAVERT